MKPTDKPKLKATEHVVKNKNSIYNIAINGLNGASLKLSSFKGKKMLFVNVASKCGFTKQYKELQQLSDMYKHSLIIIGCPCNQFGSQELGSDKQIQDFCQLNYGVTFSLTEMLYVKGSNQHPLYKWLTSKKLNGKKNSNVRWNFQKYLVDENGKLIDYYYSFTKPMSSKIRKHLK